MGSSIDFASRIMWVNGPSSHTPLEKVERVEAGR